MRFPVFFLDRLFIENLMIRPGGFVECLSAFLSQFYYYSWVGALIITVIGWFFYLALGPFVAAFTSRRVYLLRFVPAVGLLLAYNQYIHCLEGSIKILLAVLFALVYIRIPLRRAWMRWTFFLLLSVLLYCGVGTGGLLFAWFCGLFEIRRRNFITALWCFLSAVSGAYLAANYLLDSVLSKLWLVFPAEQLRKDPRIANVTIWSYLVFALVVVVLTFWPRRQASAVKSNKTAMVGEGSSSHTAKLQLVFRGFVLSAMAAMIFFSLNHAKKSQSQIAYYGYYRMWPELLQQARRVPPENYSIFLSYYVYRAIFYTGKLTSEMFSYPTVPLGLVASPKRNAYPHFIASDLFFELGMVNDAEHMAYESLETYGRHAMTLKRLALINIAKGQADTAHIFLNALSKDLIFGRWARDCLDRLRTDPLLLENSRIRQTRTYIIPDRPIVVSGSLTKPLERLLQHNRKNKMAFEYLMAWYLLNKRLEVFLGQLHRLNDFDYPDIPRHYEEAILIYTMLSKRTVDLGNRKIKPETIRRFSDFSRICTTYQNDPQTAEKELRRKGFSDTYFYYYSFE